MLCAQLLEAGHDVAAWDLMSCNALDLFHRFDIINALDVERIECDAIVHLAAVVGDAACARDPESARRVNVQGTVNMLALAARCGIPRFLFASTCSVYGASNGDVLTEDSPTNPVSLYAETKLEGERLVLESGLPSATVLRFATLWGVSPRMRFDLAINIFVRDALCKGLAVIHGGEHWRPFLYVADCARAIAFLLERDDVAGKVLNVGNAAMVTRMGDVKVQLNKFGLPCRVDPDATDQRSYRVSFERLYALDWRPQVGWFSGLWELRDHVTVLKALAIQGLIPDLYSDEWKR